MRSRSPQNGHRSLSRGLDSKVLALVREYVAELPDEPTGRLMVTVSQILPHVSASRELVRTKKSLLEKSIDRALDVLRDEAEAEDDQELDSAFEGLEGMDAPVMMTPVDINATNKRITAMWKTGNGAGGANGGVGPPTSTSGPGTPATVDPPSAPVLEPTAASGSIVAPVAASPAKKRKERKGDREESGKRPRATKGDARLPPQNISLKDLGGMEDIALQLLKDVGILMRHPEFYELSGIPPPRGVLLHGPPGCGKTMIANALAGEIGLPFISISAPSIVSGMSGESEKQLRELFDEARERAPCILFIDEIDAITPKRESAQREMERRIVAQMLTCMDDLTLEKLGGKPVVVIGATNRPDSLDPALRRAGRFDREIGLHVPDEKGREQILRVLCDKLRLSGEFDFKALAKKTPGYVGADLKSLTSAAGIVAVERTIATLTAEAAKEIEAEGVADAALTADRDSMDLDPPTSGTTLLPSRSSYSSHPELAALQHFLATHHDRLTLAQLEPLFITNADFLTALPTVQPSSKREGFATVPGVTWADIGALHPIREELQMAIVQPIARPELFAAVGITAPGGVLLWGPPGCGKTLLAKAVANESQANFISVRGPELLNKYVGESERSVRQVFARARASKPCIIFFDELDALVPRRDDALSESSARVVNTLLTELDGLEDRHGVFVIGATNRPDVIDPAMLRPGRLEKPLLVDLPGPGERLEILRTLTQKTPLVGAGEDGAVDLAAVANDPRAGYYSGADLAALVREAGTVALRKAYYRPDGALRTAGEGGEAGAGAVRLGREEFEVALTKVQPSVGKDHRDSYKKLAARFGLSHGAK